MPRLPAIIQRRWVLQPLLTGRMPMVRLQTEVTMPVLSETLTALGTGSSAACVALREALRFRARPGSLVVHDIMGRGAMILSDANKMELERHRVVWVDLADRRHPVSLFQMRCSAHFRRVWARVLRAIDDTGRFAVGNDVLDWAAEAAYSLSSDGTVGLGALFRCLSSAETRRWFLQTRNEPPRFSKLLEMLTWALSFPAVHALSEGENRGNLLEAFSKPSAITAPQLYFLWNERNRPSWRP